MSASAGRSESVEQISHGDSPKARFRHTEDLESVSKRGHFDDDLGHTAKPMEPLTRGFYRHIGNPGVL